MRFGGAAMIALAMCAVSSPNAAGSSMPVLPADEPRAPLRSVALERSHHRGMNAAQLARLSAKNARRKRRR